MGQKETNLNPCQLSNSLIQFLPSCPCWPSLLYTQPIRQYILRDPFLFEVHSAPTHNMKDSQCRWLSVMIEDWWRNVSLTLMLLVANFTNTKWSKKNSWKRLKHCQIGTHLRVLSESYLMCKDFGHLSVFLHHFVLAKLGTTSMRVNGLSTERCSRLVINKTHAHTRKSFNLFSPIVKRSDKRKSNENLEW